MVVGESVLVRPYNWSGIISFVGTTQFASGTWIGVSLDAPTGKNVVLSICNNRLYKTNVAGKHDGTVQGVAYFTCKAKHGIFVKADKLILDKRGRVLHASRSSTSETSSSNSMKRSQSKAEGMSDSARKLALSGTFVNFSCHIVT